MALPELVLSLLLRKLLHPKNQQGVAEPQFTPFELWYLRDLPRETDRLALQNTPERPAAYPPAVPFNYPN